jgi:molybdopterin biosynthesis enzyme
MTKKPDSTTQRITRLTPLGAILALIESRVGAVAPQKSPLAAALGSVLAEDVAVGPLPPMPVALRDGYAVDAAAFGEAGPYAPVALPSAACRIDVGEPLPSDANAVLALDAVNFRGDYAEAVAPVTAGEGVLPAGGDAAGRTPLRRGGERLRAIDIAVVRAAGVEDVMIRAPRISIVRSGAASTPVIDAALATLVRAVAGAGGVPFGVVKILVASLDYEQPDAVIAIGGTGSGRLDDGVRTLAQYGRVEAHGIAISPGETAALGFVGTRPVLLVPGRLDAALALWLLIGRYLVAKLAGGKVEDVPAVMPLKRKVASAIGLTEVVPVICADGVAEPLGSGYLSFESLARSDGWIVIPADSEGCAAGTPVAVRSWP